MLLNVVDPGRVAVSVFYSVLCLRKKRKEEVEIRKGREK